MYKTYVSVIPLRSSDKESERFSFRQSLARVLRQGCRSLWDFDETIAEEYLGKIKEKYKMVCVDSTIDVASYIFGVNKGFFGDDLAKKTAFLVHVEKFLQQECLESDAVLGVVGHESKNGYHVHAYAVPLHATLYKNSYVEKKKIVINYRGKYSHSKQELAKLRREKNSDQTKVGQLQTRWADFIHKRLPELERGNTKELRSDVSSLKQCLCEISLAENRVAFDEENRPVLLAAPLSEELSASLSGKAAPCGNTVVFGMTRRLARAIENVRLPQGMASAELEAPLLMAPEIVEIETDSLTPFGSPIFKGTSLLPARALLRIEHNVIMLNLILPTGHVLKADISGLVEAVEKDTFEVTQKKSFRLSLANKNN